MAYLSPAEVYDWCRKNGPTSVPNDVLRMLAERVREQNIDGQQFTHMMNSFVLTSLGVSNKHAATVRKAWHADYPETKQDHVPSPKRDGGSYPPHAQSPQGNMGRGQSQDRAGLESLMNEPIPLSAVKDVVDRLADRAGFNREQFYGWAADLLPRGTAMAFATVSEGFAGNGSDRGADRPGDRGGDRSGFGDRGSPMPSPGQGSRTQTQSPGNQGGLRTAGAVRSKTAWGEPGSENYARGGTSGAQANRGHNMSSLLSWPEQQGRASAQGSVGGSVAGSVAGSAAGSYNFDAPPRGGRARVPPPEEQRGDDRGFGFGDSRGRDEPRDGGFRRDDDMQRDSFNPGGRGGGDPGGRGDPWGRAPDGPRGDPMDRMGGRGDPMGRGDFGGRGDFRDMEPRGRDMEPRGRDMEPRGRMDPGRGDPFDAPMGRGDPGPGRDVFGRFGGGRDEPRDVFGRDPRDDPRGGDGFGPDPTQRDLFGAREPPRDDLFGRDPRDEPRDVFSRDPRDDPYARGTLPPSRDPRDDPYARDPRDDPYGTMPPPAMPRDPRDGPPFGGRDDPFGDRPGPGRDGREDPRHEDRGFDEGNFPANRGRDDGPMGGGRPGRQDVQPARARRESPAFDRGQPMPPPEEPDDGGENFVVMKPPKRAQQPPQQEPQEDFMVSKPPRRPQKIITDEDPRDARPRQPSAPPSGGPPRQPLQTGEGPSSRPATAVAQWLRQLPDTQVPEDIREAMAASVERSSIDGEAFTKLIQTNGLGSIGCKSPAQWSKVKKFWQNVLQEEGMCKAAANAAAANNANAGKKAVKMIV